MNPSGQEHILWHVHIPPLRQYGSHSAERTNPKKLKVFKHIN